MNVLIPKIVTNVKTYSIVIIAEMSIINVQIYILMKIETIAEIRLPMDVKLFQIKIIVKIMESYANI